MIFYVPALHRLAAPDDLPPQAAFFPASLPASRPGQAAEEQPQTMTGQASGEERPDRQGGPDKAEEERRRAESLAALMLPLDFAEAGAMLADMLRQGEEHAAGGALKQMAALGAAYGHDLSLRAEMADLARFVGTGADGGDAGGGPGLEAASGDQLAEKRRRALVDCQKVLLLAHYLEERALEIAALGARAMAAEAALLSALGDDGAELSEEPFADVSETAGNGPASACQATSFALSFGASWQSVVDAVLPFLPEEAVLLTCDPNMIGDLREAGLLLPLPAERAPFALAGPWPPKRELWHASLPAWRLVGRRGPLAERPWLERVLEIYAALPVPDALKGKNTVKGPGLWRDRDE